MAKVSTTTDLPVSAATVWSTIGGFNALARWHPAIAKCEETKEQGATLRRLTLHGGGTILERLEARDETGRSYTYSIVEGPVPAKGYRSTISVRDRSGGKGCTVEWSSEFEPSGVPESEAVKVIRGVYEAGLHNLQKMFGA